MRCAPPGPAGFSLTTAGGRKPPAGRERRAGGCLRISGRTDGRTEPCPAPRVEAARRSPPGPPLPRGPRPPPSWRNAASPSPGGEHPGGGTRGGDGHATTKRPARPFRLLPRPFRRGFPQQPKRGWAGVKRRPPDTCRGPAGSGGSHSFHSQEDFSSPLPAPVSFPTECVSIGALLWRSAVGGNSKKNRFAALENFSNGFSLSPVSCQQQPLRGNPSYFLSSF